MPLTTVFNQLCVIEILLIALTIPMIILKTTNIFERRCHYFRVAMCLTFLPFAKDLVTIRVCHRAIATSFTVLDLSDIYCAIFVLMNDLFCRCCSFDDFFFFFRVDWNLIPASNYRLLLFYLAPAANFDDLRPLTLFRVDQGCAPTRMFT